MSAAQAQSQMYPGIANLDAVFTDAFVSSCNLDLLRMLAGFHHTASATRVLQVLLAFPVLHGPTCRDSRRLHRCSARIREERCWAKRPCGRLRTSAEIPSGLDDRRPPADSLAAAQIRPAQELHRKKMLHPLPHRPQARIPHCSLRANTLPG